MGFFTDTTVCIGCKACEVACKQWNDLPSDGGTFRKGGSYDSTGRLSGNTWRHVRFVELADAGGGVVEEEIPDLVATAAGERLADRRRGGRGGVRQLGLHVRRLQALHERGLPGRVPDGRADPHRVRDRGAAARRLQRLRLLRARPARSASSTARPRTAAPASARSATTGSRTAWSPRARRRARPTRSSSGPTTSSSRSPSAASPRCTRAASRAPTSTAPPTRPSSQLAGGLGAFFLLTEKPERYGLPAQRGLADPGERRARHARRDGRRAARRGRRRRRLPVGEDAVTRLQARRRQARLARRSASARGEKVDLHIGQFKDGRWSYLFGDDTEYRAAMPDLEAIEQAARARAHRRAARRRPGAGHQRAGVDLGGPALLLVRRHRGRLVVRRARLRPGRRRGLGRGRAQGRAGRADARRRRC